MIGSDRLRLFNESDVSCISRKWSFSISVALSWNRNRTTKEKCLHEALIYRLVQEVFRITSNSACTNGLSKSSWLPLNCGSQPKYRVPAASSGSFLHTVSITGRDPFVLW